MSRESAPILDNPIADRLAALALAAIIIGSLLPDPGLGGGHGGDKVIHFLAYGLVGLLSVLQRQSYLGALAAVIALILISAAIEVVQPFVGRQGEVADLIANATGTMIGGFVGQVLRRIRFPV